FQVVNGQVSPIASGVAQNSFPSLSRDGRFVTFADTDTFRPAQTSPDLYLFDRASGQTRRIIDYTTEALQDGSFATSLPQFSALSPNNLFVALTTQVLITTNNAGSSSTPILGVYRVSDGLQLSVAEFGQGNALDFFRSEHVGISW